MGTEHYTVVSQGRRTVIAVVDAEKLSRIGASLETIGAARSGPSSWDCGADLAVDQIQAAVGELDEGEVIYLIGGEGRSAFGVLVRPRTDGGVVVGQ